MPIRAEEAVRAPAPASESWCSSTSEWLSSSVGGDGARSSVSSESGLMATRVTHALTGTPEPGRAHGTVRRPGAVHP